MKAWVFILFGFVLSLSSFAYAQDDCHFKETVWNATKKYSIQKNEVRTTKSDLKKEYIGPKGCSICLEDQVTVRLKNKIQFQVCHQISDQVQKTLNELIEKGVPILSVTGYRPSRSRGPLDAKGNRTILSDHAFGTALDINREFNGLYDNCRSWNQACRKRQGGHYKPDSSQSWTSKHILTLKLKALGFKWGGEWQGVLKDFMHFEINDD